MKNSESDFDISKPLPPNLVLTSAGNHLYKIGLSLFPFGSETRRPFYNPYFISLIISIYFIRSLTALLLNEDNDKNFIIIGDFAHFVKAKYHLNIALILYCFLAFVSQLINYWNHYNDIKPSFLKPFEMMSGLVSPQSIGLTNIKDINELLKRSRILFKTLELYSMTVILIVFSFCGIVLSLNSSVYEMFLFSIPWSIVYTTFVHNCNNLLSYQIVYFYIICFYLRSKIVRINEEINSISISKRRIQILQMTKILKIINSIHSEINEYNKKYWSKYLLLILLTLIMVINLNLFHTFFS